MGAVFHASKWDFGLLNSSFFSNVNLVVLCIALGEMEKKKVDFVFFHHIP